MFYWPFNAKAVRVVPLAIALMAIAVLLLPGNSVQAQQATVVQYNENDTVPVITLTATDPEGASPIVWSMVLPNDTRLPFDEEDEGFVASVLDAGDSADFKISDDGVLEFRNEPDFETVDAAQANQANSEYKALMQASDGTEMSWFKVIVRVMDVEEEGSIKLRPTAQTLATLVQPQVRVGINAHMLTDPDGSGRDTRSTSTITTARYQWYRTSSRTVTGTKNPDRRGRCNRTDLHPQGQGGRQRRWQLSPGSCDLHRRKEPQQDRYGGVGVCDDWHNLRQHAPRVFCRKHFEGGLGGNAKRHGHRHPGGGHRQGQRRGIDLLAGWDRCCAIRC